MSQRRRGRGSGDSPSLSGKEKWVGARLWKMLAASFFLHALLSPAPLLLGLGALLPLLGPPEEKLPPEEALTAIPIDLLEEDALGPTEAEPEAPAPRAEPSEPATVFEPEAPAPKPPEPNPPDPPKPAPAEKPTAAEEPKSEAKEFADPVSLAGSAGELADSNAHVRILIYNEIIRAHPLGKRVGGLLRRTPQWRDFFGPSGVDPVLDVNRVLIAGPQLRDSSNVVAVVEHRLGDAAIEEALARLVSRNGEWLRKSPPLARARADRAERIFSAPRTGLVAVAPLSAEKSVRKLGPKLRFPPGPEHVAVQAFIDRPHRPLRALGLRIPSSLEWLRIELEPSEDGGVKIRLLAQDASPEEARKNAGELQALLRSAAEVDFGRMGTWGALASLAFGGPKQKLVESIDLFAEKDQVRGLVRMTREQLQNVGDLLDAFLPPEIGSGPGTEPSPPAGLLEQELGEGELGPDLAPGASEGSPSPAPIPTPGGSDPERQDPRPSGSGSKEPGPGESGSRESAPQGPAESQPDEREPGQDSPPD